MANQKKPLELKNINGRMSLLKPIKFKFNKLKQNSITYQDMMEKILMIIAESGIPLATISSSIDYHPSSLTKLMQCNRNIKLKPLIKILNTLSFQVEIKISNNKKPHKLKINRRGRPRIQQ